MMLKILPIPLLLLFVSYAQAQNSAQRGTAGDIYENMGYYKVIAIQEDEDLNFQSMERMANSFRLNHDTWNAEKWYARIVHESNSPLHFLHYAQALQSNGHLEKAKEYYLKYDEMIQGQSDDRGKKHAEAIDRIADLSQAQDFQLTNVYSINSDYLDFSPAYCDGGIVFVSTRTTTSVETSSSKDKDAWTGESYASLFFAASGDGGQLQTPKKFSVDLSSRFHEGPLSFAKDGSQLFFTRNEKKKKGEGAVRLEIFVADKIGDRWTAAKKLNLENDQANNAHPAISANGKKLFFASDRDGGYGGMDLYVSSFKNGEWKAPVNLGPTINTAGNEAFPFVHIDGTLYFSSDGWGGLGGLDLFYANPHEELGFEKAVNLKAPFNSNMDDFGYVLNVEGTEGYLTSARSGGLGKDDIYRFLLPVPQSNKNEKKISISLCVNDQLSGDPIEGAEFALLTQKSDGSYTGYDEQYEISFRPKVDSEDFLINRTKIDPFGGNMNLQKNCVSDSNGAFKVLLSPGSKYLLWSRMAGYQEVLMEIEGENPSPGNCISMRPTNCISLDGKIAGQNDEQPIVAAQISLLNLCTGETRNVFSDAGGHFDFCLSCDCDYVLTGAKDDFKAASALLTTSGLDCESDLSSFILEKELRLLPGMDHTGKVLSVVHSNERKEGHLRKEGVSTSGNPLGDLKDGLIIGLENIYYEYNQYQLQLDAKVELDKVVDLMRRNPGISIEVRSHTDSRGGDDYNRVLSQKRAKVAADYIVNQGIDEKRLSALGYGEDLLVNECDDGSNCEEKDHQVNRRTEIRIFNQHTER